MTKDQFNELKYFNYNEVFLNGQMQFLDDGILVNTAFQSMKLVDDHRHFIGLPIKLHCAHQNGGHASNSYHYRPDKTAIDYSYIKEAYPNGVSYKDIIEQSLNFIQSTDSKVGFGIYPDWNHNGFHIDPRGYDKLWVRLNYDRPGYRAGYHYDDNAKEILEYLFGITV